MNSSESNATASIKKQDTILVPTQDAKPSRVFGNYDSSSFETRLAQKLPKISLNMKTHLSSDRRLLHRLNEDRRKYIFTLNPECHLKFLEENLSFLTKKQSRCIDFKISGSKSSSHSVENFQKVTSVTEGKFHSLTFTSPSGESFSQCKLDKKMFDTGCSKDNKTIDRPNVKVSDVFLLKHPVEMPSFGTSPVTKILSRPSSNSKSKQVNKFQSNRNVNPINNVEPVEILKNKTDYDNQFEYTVAEENIVAFVCSPPASRKQKITNGMVHMEDSDEECFSKESSQTTSSVSSQNSYCKNTDRKCTQPVQEQTSKSNTLLPHPPSISGVVSVRESKSVSRRSSINFNQKSTEGCINFFGSFNSLYAFNIASDANSKTLYNHETIMFRETALRGCYDIETVIKEFRSELPEVVKQVSQTREAIFSAVRLQKDNESIISDAALSIVDICNSWIKLSTHFERQDFKNFLETNGVDLSISGDFMQWQSISRIFVDKLIHVMKNLAFDKGPKLNRHFEPMSSRGPKIVKNRHREPMSSREFEIAQRTHLELKGETTINKVQRDMPKPNTTILETDSQGKRWKQRRFLSERIDSEKMLLENSRAFRPDLTSCGPQQNILFTNSHKNYPVLGQGDTELNISCTFPKENVESTNNCQFAQGVISLLPTEPTEPNCNNSGFLDNNLSAPNTKWFNVRSETCISNVPPTNECCTAFANPLGVQLNNCFPVNIQHTLPVVTQYNNHFCHLNSNQLQPNSKLCPAKPNPIHCTDFDATENCTQSSYMKPGHYTPPQKPVSSQKVVNNTFPIEDIPAVGVPFHFTSSISASQQLRSIEYLSGCSKTQLSKDNSEKKGADFTWRSTLAITEASRESFVTNRVDEFSNSKVSDSPDFNSHFLLSNNSFNCCTEDNFKINNDDSSRSPSNGNSDVDQSLTIKLETKSADLLVEPFEKISLEGEYALEKFTIRAKIQPGNDLVDSCKSSNNPNKQKNQESQFALAQSRLNISEEDKDNEVDPSLRATGENLLKKPKKIKKGRNSYTLFDRNNPTFHNKPDTMVFATTMSNKVTGQLEEILNCIWNTQVSTLIEDETRSEKELAKLEMKVRSPLYFQAMKCKLRNRSYDTLDQALSDSHQYFVDIRSRNKGDKLCSDLIDALEQVFFEQVEKHFGLTYQPMSQNNFQAGEHLTFKTRRQKKTPRRF